jgi:hypothetical protein
VARLPLHRWRYSTRLLFSGCDQATYQQDLVIHRTAGQDYEEVSGGLKVWHIYIGPKCRPDYGDLRFTDRYGRELAYYLWPDYDSSSARFAVRLEGADAAGEVTAWYGNAAATTTSNGGAAYLFFDDFGGSEIDNENWWVYDGSPYIQGGTMVCPSVSTVYSRAPINLNNVVVARSKLSTMGANYIGLIAVKGTSPSGPGTYGYAIITHTGAIKGHNIKEGTHETYTDFGTSEYSNEYYISEIRKAGTTNYYKTTDKNGVVKSGSSSVDSTSNNQGYLFLKGYNGGTFTADYIYVRAYSATPPTLLRTSRGANPSYAGLARLLLDDVIRFGGVGSVQVLGDEIYSVAGAGGFSIETSVRSSILVAGTGALSPSLHLTPSAAGFGGAGAAASEPVRFRTPIVAEGGVGSAYVAPAPIQFDMSKYKFESLIVSRSAQDALWKCDGKIDGLQAPLAYKAFDIKVPDHAGTLHTIFYGFVPGRDYVQAVAANKSIVQGYDAGFYLARQYLPDGDLSYPAAYNWPPSNLLRYWLGEESNQVGSHSRWEKVSGVMPYRIDDPTTWGHPYTPKDWVFQPRTSKMQAIQEVCEYSGMVFLVKWRKIDGRIVPCAYFVHQDDIDDPGHGLDLPSMTTFTAPDPCIADEIRATLRSDEKYNRIIVRSSSPSGAWFEAIRETPALQTGDELPIEYLEERSDLPEDADHAGWCASRADELYAYYTAYAYTYTMTLIDRTDLELYQRCRFYGFGSIPDGETMRIVSIRYVVKPTHTNVEITITPDSRLSDLRRLQRSQAADGISEMQTIAQSQIDQVARGEAGTVVGIDGSEATVEMERGTDMTGRIV